MPRLRLRPDRVRPVARPRRGAALILTMILTVAFAAMAMGAIYMTGNAALIGSSYDRERDYRYGAEAALGIAKSQLSGGLFTLPDTGYTVIMSGATITGADGLVVPRVLVNLYAGPTGSTSGQDGTFASIVAEATDGSGARYVRRLELAQETFAKFAYFSVKEKSPSGGTIYFGGGDVIYGPLFSNDTINILAGTCPTVTFRDQVQTAKIIVSPGCAAFSAYGYQINMPGIPLPTDTRLATLSSYATPANFLFTPRDWTPVITPTGLGTYSPVDTMIVVGSRLEFVNHDLDNDGSTLDPQDGFFRVYDSSSPLPVYAADPLGPTTPATVAALRAYVRGDTPSPLVTRCLLGSSCGTFTAATRYDTTSISKVLNCGDWHRTGRAGTTARTHRFFPFAMHSRAWFTDSVLLKDSSAVNGGQFLAAATATTHVAQTLVQLMTNVDGQSQGIPRCYLGGDPHLVWVERYGMAGYTSNDWQKGGDDTTFTPNGRFGTWKSYPGTIDGRLTSGGGARSDANYLFPIYRGINAGARGVIQVNGSIGVSGVVRGRITLYANGGNIVILDNLRYAISPSNPDCLGERDILGLIASKNVTLANNTLLDPQQPSAATTYTAAGWKSYNPGSPPQNPIAPTGVGLQLHAVIMTLNNSFRNEGYRGGSSAATIATCGTSNSGRGCLNLTGGILMDTRGIVALTGLTGFVKRYAYDRCAATRPPPYFPTTGRFIDNRFYEIDPVKFNRVGVALYFATLTAGH